MSRLRRWLKLHLITLSVLLVAASCATPPSEQSLSITSTPDYGRVAPTSTATPLGTATPRASPVLMTATPTVPASTAELANEIVLLPFVMSDGLPIEPLPVGVITETVVADTEGLVVAMAFAPDGRLFYTTKGSPGLSETDADTIAQVRIVDRDGTLRPEPFLTTRVNIHGERGLIGIVFDPQYASNHYVYVFKTAPAFETGTGLHANRLIRYTEDPRTQTAIPASEVILMDLPTLETDLNIHNAGNMRFGPDGKLYVSVGEYGHPFYASDLSSPLGKIHRLNSDGTAPEDNPFVDTPDAVASIWTYGHRNSFDLAFDPLSGGLFFTENGPRCNDEVNLAHAGADYGWRKPIPPCEDHIPPGTVAPLMLFPFPIGIGGIDVYMGAAHSWYGSLFWCAVNTGALYRGQLDEKRTSIVSVHVVQNAPECRVDVAYGPDGSLYLSSWDSIARIRPVFSPMHEQSLPLE